MTEIFESIVHMSAVASIVIITVIVLRFCLRSAPKKFSYILWAVVLVRLLCPLSIESPFSTMPRSNGAVELLENWEDDYVGTHYTYHDMLPEYDAAVDAGIEPIYMPDGGSYVNVAPDGISPAPTVETEWMPILARIWLCGIAAMAAWALIDWLRLRLRLRTAIREEDGVYTTDAVDSPFVLGLIRPKIYLPAALAEGEREYILLHERCHIRRMDHWIKLLSFAALALHWFNPLVWLAFVLSSRDMEMSCDEAVIKKLGGEKRGDYSASLLALATGRRRVSVTPLAFGEGDPKGRISNLANWRKPTIWIIIVAVLVCIVAAVCLLTDPVSPKPQIKMFDCIYTYSEEHEPGFDPVEGRYIGKIQGVTFDTNDEPELNYWVTNLGEEFLGKTINVRNARTICLFDENGELMEFKLDRGQTEPKDIEIHIIHEGVDYRFYTDWDGVELPDSSRSLGRLEKNVKSSEEVPEGDIAGINVPDYLLGNELWQHDSELFLDNGEGGWLAFSSDVSAELVTELMRGDFDNDGREDYLEAVRVAADNRFLTLYLKDAETEEELWSDVLSTHDDGQKMLTYCRSESLGNYFVRDSYDAAYDCLRCRSFTIEDGKEKVIRQWEEELPRFPDVPTEADFALAVMMSLPANSTVLASTLGGLLLTGPISGKDKLGYSEATDVFSGDFDHDGEDEIIVAAPDPVHPTQLWHLYMEEQDGTVIWLEQDFATSHAGWKCILAYEGSDGEDYLIRYDPAMFQGIANYRCEQFYIKDGKEVLQNKWNAEFEIPTEMTSEMEEFAAAMEILLSRSYLLLSTLDGEVNIGPTRGDVAGLLPVDYGFSDEMEAWEYFCKGAMADMMAAEASHYTWEVYIDSVLRTDMPRNEGWFFADSWFQHSELLSDGRSYESVFLEMDGTQYAWSRIDGREQLLTSDSGEYDAYGRSVFDTWLNYDLEFVSKTETENGLELVFEALWEGENPTNGQQTFIFDKNERLSEARFESDVPYTDAYGTRSTVRTVRQTIVVAFPKVSEAMCRGMIEEAYEHFAEEELDLYELLDTIKAGDITVLWPYDAVDAGTLAMALNGLDESDAVAERSEDGNLIEWSLWPYLEGGEDGTNYAMRHLELACGPDEDYVLVRLVDSGRSRQEWFKDETLYDLLRHMRDYEELVEREGREKYGEIIDNILREYLEEYKGNPMEFKSAELTRLVYLGGYDHADGSRVDIYDFRFAFVPTSIKTNALAGGAYIDSELRVQGFGPTHLAVKHKTGADVEYAVLSDSFFIYSGGEVNAEKRDIIERNLQSAAPNGAPADAIIDDGSSYPLAIPYGKTVITDLDGDGVKETVRQTVNGAGYRIDSFTINGVEYIDTVREISGPFHNTEADYYGYWYLADIVESDGFLEITVYDGGPSGDPVTHFYNYSSAAFTYSGSVPSPAAELKYDGKGYITGSARLAVFQTWFAEHTWSIFGPGRMIQPEPREFYEVAFRFRDYTIGMDYFPGSDTNPLLQEILAYEAADKASESWTLPKGTQIGLLGTDNREWLLATADGEECWLHFEGTSLDAPGGLMRDASKVLNGLHYYD